MSLNNVGFFGTLRSLCDIGVIRCPHALGAIGVFR